MKARSHHSSNKTGEDAMQRLCFFMFMTAVVALAPSSRADEGALKTLAARTELHAIQTLTLSDQQFLRGDQQGQPVTISGQLRIAQGAGRLPVVVMQHGSGGMGGNLEMWAREFNAMGISTFTLDSFTGRGLTQVSSDQARLGRLNFVLDIYRGLEILAKHPRVDSARIALMGFSRGGQAVLYASVNRFQQTWNKSGVDAVAYIPFYPDCMTRYVGDTEIADRPVRIFVGAPDDYNPAGPCKAHAERLRAAGRDVQFTEYPNAPHSFDNPLNAQPPRVSPNSQTVRNCVIREDAAGTLINTATNEPFSYQDKCVERGPSLGHDPVATQAAKQAVKDFIKVVLKL
jgi:dienelactone hydrolase